MRHRYAFAARVLAVVAAIGALAAWTLSPTVPPTRTAMYAALTGDWTGALEYKDYSRPDKRVTLPTTLRIRFAPDSSALLMHYRYDDGPGKIVEDDDKFAVNAGVNSVVWGGVKDTLPQQFRLRELPRTDRILAFVLEGEGSDNDKPATIRETFEISATTLRILKETRPVGGEFGFRHEYRFRR